MREIDWGIENDEITSRLNALDAELEDDIDPDLIQDHIKNQGSVVASTIPELYRELCRKVDGEVVVKDAFDGQYEFPLSLAPVIEDSVMLFLDFGRNAPLHSLGSNVIFNLTDGDYPTGGLLGSQGTSGSISWSQRTRAHAMPDSQYDVDLNTGTVTLTGGRKLSRGQQVVADYEHDAMSQCANLREIVILLAAAELGLSLPRFGSEARDQLEKMQARGDAKLLAIRDGVSGIDLFDQLTLVHETRIARQQTKKFFRLPF